MVEVKIGGEWVSLNPMLRAKIHASGGLRTSAKIIGISAATMSRVVGKGAKPDLDTFGLLWEWLGMRIEGVRVKDVK